MAQRWRGRPGQAGGMPLDQWRNTANGKRWFAGQAQRQRAAARTSDMTEAKNLYGIGWNQAQQSTDTALGRMNEQEAQQLARLNEQEQFALSQQDPWNRVEQSVNENAANRGILRSGMANQNLSDAADRWGAQRAGISRPIAQARQEMLGTNAWNRGAMQSNLAAYGQQQGPTVANYFRDLQRQRVGRTDALAQQNRDYYLNMQRLRMGQQLGEQSLDQAPTYERLPWENSWQGTPVGDPAQSTKAWNKNRKNVKTPKGKEAARQLANQEAYAALAAQKFAWESSPDRQKDALAQTVALAKAQAKAQADLRAEQNRQMWAEAAAGSTGAWQNAGATPEVLATIAAQSSLPGVSDQDRWSALMGLTPEMRGSVRSWLAGTYGKTTPQAQPGAGPVSIGGNTYAAPQPPHDYNYWANDPSMAWGMQNKAVPPALAWMGANVGYPVLSNLEKLRNWVGWGVTGR